MSFLWLLWLMADRGHLCTCPLRNSLGYKDPHPETSRSGNAPQQVSHRTAQRSSNLSAHLLVAPVLYHPPGSQSQQNRCSATWSQILYRLARLTPVPPPRPYMLTLFCKNNECLHIFMRGRNLPAIHSGLLGLLWEGWKKQDQKAQETSKVASLWHRRS